MTLCGPAQQRIEGPDLLHVIRFGHVRHNKRHIFGQFVLILPDQGPADMNSTKNDRQV